MRRRPWPIVILALVHILAPVANFAYSAWLMHYPLHRYIALMFGHSYWFDSMAHYIGSPIAGVAIYKTNKWSYSVFLGVMLWILCSNVLQWHEFPEYFSLSSLLLAFALNLTIVSYFLIPEVRKVYFNPRLRWWESKPRYDVVFEARIVTGEFSKECTVQNISEGGVFVHLGMILLTECELDLSFQAFGKSYEIPAKVVHLRRASPLGYGLQFQHSPESQKEFKELIKTVKHSGAEERIGNVNLKQEFLLWLKMVIKSGKGLLPNSSPEHPTPAVATEKPAESDFDDSGDHRQSA